MRLLYKELKKLEIDLNFFIPRKDTFGIALNIKRQSELKDKIEFLRQKDILQAARIKKLALADLFFAYLKDFGFFQKLQQKSKEDTDKRKILKKLKTTSAIIASLKKEICDIEDELKQAHKLKEAHLIA